MLPFGRLWYDTPDNAIGYAMHSSRSHDAVIRVYDDAGKCDRNTRTRGRPYSETPGLLALLREFFLLDDTNLHM